MTHQIVRYPAGVLMDVAEPVTEFGEELQALARDLAETCTEYQGLGLAAPQIGVNQRVIFVKGPDHDPLVLVNPSWHPAPVANTWLADEGCLSLPGLQVTIERVDTIEVQALTVNREPLEFVAQGLWARTLQHEIDHLEGTLTVDHLSKGQRSLVLAGYRKNLKKMTRNFNRMVKGRAA
jgi:peptide deformylase